MAEPKPKSNVFAALLIVASLSLLLGTVLAAVELRQEYLGDAPVIGQAHLPPADTRSDDADVEEEPDDAEVTDADMPPDPDEADVTDADLDVADPVGNLTGDVEPVDDEPIDEEPDIDQPVDDEPVDDEPMTDDGDDDDDDGGLFDF